MDSSANFTPYVCFSHLRGQWKETLERVLLFFNQILNGEWQLNPASKTLISSKPKLILPYEAAKEENSCWTSRIGLYMV